MIKINKNKIIKIRGLIIFYLFITFLIFSNIHSVKAFIGPPCAPGQCQGRIAVDSDGNVSMGTSTPQSGTKTLIISQTSDSSTYGLKVLSSNNSPLFLVRSDGRISIATSGASYALTVSGDIYASGNLIIGGSFSAPISAGNVTPGVFNSLQGGGTGAYAFLGNLGVATSSQVGLPQTLSVYGGGYFLSNVGIGITTPLERLHVRGNVYFSGTDIINRLWTGNIPTFLVENLGNSNTFYVFGTRTNAGVGLVVTNAANVGVGTTTPAYRLHVIGQINASGGLCIAGDCRTSWSGIGSQWTNTTGGIYYLGNVGIGTSTVSYPLFVSTSTDNLFAIQRQGATSPTIFKQGTDSAFVINNAGSNVLTIRSGNIGIGTTTAPQKLTVSGNIGIAAGAHSFIGTLDNFDLNFRTNNLNRMVIKNNGNVGIAEATPLYTLDVGGQINAASGLCIAQNCITSWSQVGGGSSQWTNTTGGIYYLGNVGIGTSTVSYPLFVSTSTDNLFAIQRQGATSPTIFKQGTDSAFVINNAGSNVLAIKSGNVGIGTTEPTSKLYVSGDLTVTGAKSFEVDYPQDPSKKIVYVALEGPEAGTYIRGIATCQNLETQIIFPDYFRVVTAQNGLTASLTPRNSFSNLYIKELTNEKLIVGCETGKSFDYIVFGVRKGYENFEVVRPK